MPDLFDHFSGSAGPLHGRVSPQGGTWSDPTGQCSIDGSGSVYSSGTVDLTNIPLSSNLPGTDCAASLVVGADFLAQITSGLNLALRVSGSPGTQKYYLCQMYYQGADIYFTVYQVVSGTATPVPGFVPTLLTVAVNDIWTFTVVGTGASVALTAYRNGTLITSQNDTSPARITTGNGVGLIIPTAVGHTDMMRTVWAGAVPATGPPAITMAPPSPTVGLSGNQAFTATTAFTGETFNWSASAGTISGNLATETWTAPGSGSSATVTGTSIDLPTRTATASVTLTSAGASAFALTGPASGYKSNASSNFTFTPTGGSYTGTITPTMTGLAGTWAPTSLSWSASSTAKTATFTPSAVGSGNANGTASPALTAPANVAYTSNPQTLAVTPGALPTSSTTPETFTGGGTFWLTSAPTFTPSGVAGVSIGAVTVDSNTQAHAMITTGTATGTITWTDSTTGATVTELVAAIANVLSIGEGFATGLSTVGYAVYDTSGASVTAWSAVGVTERGSSSGDYGAVVPIPQDGADYEIRWSQGSGTTPPFVHDIRRAAAPATGGTGGGPTAAQIAAAVWQDATAGDFTITGSIGKYIMTGVTINLAQSGFTPRNLGTVADAALTVGDALLAAICAAAGKETVVGTTYTIKSPSTGSVIRTFTLDSASSPSSRN